MQVVWPALRLVLEGKATLAEVQTSYTIDDVALMNEALDAWGDAQRRAQPKAGKP